MLSIVANHHLVLSTGQGFLHSAATGMLAPRQKVLSPPSKKLTHAPTTTPLSRPITRIAW
jgi:hypothetical protein